MARPKVASGYRQRHSQNTLIVLLFMMIIVIGSGAYIISYGLNHRPSNEEGTTGLVVKIVVYSENKNVAGRITINTSNGTVFQALIVGEDGIVSGVKNHPLGSYELYYIGDANTVTFGPVVYTVSEPNKLLYDSMFSEIRVTIMTV
jgi:hypothetical protein